MRFVRLRSQCQSDVQALHRVREGLVTEKTATSNRIRALLAENGIIIKQGPANVFARTLLIHCVRAALRSFTLGKRPFGDGFLDQWVITLLERRGKTKQVIEDRLAD